MELHLYKWLFFICSLGLTQIDLEFNFNTKEQQSNMSEAPANYK